MTIDVTKGVYKMSIRNQLIVLAKDGVEHDTRPFDILVLHPKTDKPIKLLPRIDSIISGTCDVEVTSVDEIRLVIFVRLLNSFEEELKLGKPSHPTERCSGYCREIEPISGKYYARCTPVSIVFMNENLEGFSSFKNPDRFMIDIEGIGVKQFDLDMYFFDGWREVIVTVSNSRTVTFKVLCTSSPSDDTMISNREFVSQFLFKNISSRSMFIAERVRAEVQPWASKDDVEYFTSEESVLNRLKEYAIEVLTDNKGYHYSGSRRDIEEFVIGIMFGWNVGNYLMRLGYAGKIHKDDISVYYDSHTGMFGALSKSMNKTYEELESLTHL